MLIRAILCTVVGVISLIAVILAGAKSKGKLTLKTWPGRCAVVATLLLMLAVVGCVFTWSDYSDQKQKEQLLADTVARALQGKPQTLDVKIDDEKGTGTAEKDGVRFSIDAQFTRRMTSTQQGWACEVHATPIH